jgi:hypothetical protein
MIIPRTTHTHLEIISRGDGGSLAGAIGYARGERVRDYQGEIFDFSYRAGKEEIEARVLRGWAVQPGESEQQAVQRLATEVGVRGQRRDATEGRTFVFEIPVEASPTERQQILDRAAERMHAATGCAVGGAVHSPPAGSLHLENVHGHLVVSHRQVRDGAELGAVGKVLNHPTSGGKVIDQMRHDLCREFNELSRMHGWGREWSPATYEVLYQTLNKEREAKGLETLEVPIPQRHEGAALTGLKRRGVRSSAMVARNEEIRKENSERGTRNRERIGRDKEILDLQPRLEAQQKLSEIIRQHAGKEIPADLKPTLNRLATTRGKLADFTSRVVTAQSASLAHLAGAFGSVIHAVFDEEKKRQRQMEGRGR